MAGDWIKMEKATATKPEILRLADLLGIHPAHAFGLCFRFWSWADDQLCDGHAPSVTNVTLDSVIGHAGFTSALLSVGWLQVRSGSLVIPNFDRHLSESAKNRALSGERKKKQRKALSRSERDKSVTREEKRRDINTETQGTLSASSVPQTACAVSSDAPKGNASKRSMPAFVRPTVADVVAYVLEIGGTVDARQFVDFYASNGWKVGRNAMKDWRATVRQWEARKREGNHYDRRNSSSKESARESANADAFAVCLAAADAASGG